MNPLAEGTCFSQVDAVPCAEKVRQGQPTSRNQLLRTFVRGKPKRNFKSWQELGRLPSLVQSHSRGDASFLESLFRDC